LASAVVPPSRTCSSGADAGAAAALLSEVPAEVGGASVIVSAPPVALADLPSGLTDVVPSVGVTVSPMLASTLLSAACTC
jgi:hypothetical protein